MLHMYCSISHYNFNHVYSKCSLFYILPLTSTISTRLDFVFNDTLKNIFHDAIDPRKGTCLNMLLPLGTDRPPKEPVLICQEGSTMLSRISVQYISGHSLSLQHLANCILDAVSPNQISNIEVSQ